MAEQGIVRYQASDGSEVKLSPSIVARYIITGGQQVEDREVFAFMAKCQARHLNPLAGDAYMTAYRNKKTGRVEASVIVSKDYFVRTATQQPGFDGIKAGIVVWDKRAGEMKYREGTIYGTAHEKLVGGWAEVYDKGRSHPSRAEVSLEEYDQHRNLWNSKPATMIRKVALVQALREAYPGAYGGVYDRDEMPEPPEPVAAQAAEVEAEVEATPHAEPQPQPQQQPEQEPLQEQDADAEPSQAVDLTPVRSRFAAYREARAGISAAQATDELTAHMGVGSMGELTNEQVEQLAGFMEEIISGYERSLKEQPASIEGVDVAEADYEF